MDDYIDILLEHLSNQRCSLGGWLYAVRQRQELQAQEALTRTLTEEQHKLFLAYDEARNAAGSVSEEAYARAAFLLAKEIYR